MLESAAGQAEGQPEAMGGFERSRLSCQIRLTPELDGLTVTIPEVRSTTSLARETTSLPWKPSRLYDTR